MTALTQTVDVLPTACDLYGIPYPRESVQGRSICPLLDGTAKAVHDYAFATCIIGWPSYLVRSADWSLILYQGGALRALYDLRTDPKQMRNVIEQHPHTAAKMLAAFKAFARTQSRSLTEFTSADAKPRPREAPQSKLSERARRELKALGYVQ